MVRPMWINGAGFGYQPTLSDMVNTMKTFFGEDRQKYPYTIISHVPDYPYFDVEVGDRHVMVTIHHTPFF